MMDVSKWCINVAAGVFGGLATAVTAVVVAPVVAVEAGVNLIAGSFSTDEKKSEEKK